MPLPTTRHQPQCQVLSISHTCIMHGFFTCKEMLGLMDLGLLKQNNSYLPEAAVKEMIVCSVSPGQHFTTLDAWNWRGGDGWWVREDYQCNGFTSHTRKNCCHSMSLTIVDLALRCILCLLPLKNWFLMKSYVHAEHLLKSNSKIIRYWFLSPPLPPQISHIAFHLLFRVLHLSLLAGKEDGQKMVV